MLGIYQVNWLQRIQQRRERGPSKNKSKLYTNLILFPSTINSRSRGGDEGHRCELSVNPSIQELLGVLPKCVGDR